MKKNSFKTHIITAVPALERIDINDEIDVSNDEIDVSNDGIDVSITELVEVW